MTACGLGAAEALPGLAGTAASATGSTEPASEAAGQAPLLAAEQGAEQASGTRQQLVLLASLGGLGQLAKPVLGLRQRELRPIDLRFVLVA